VGDYFVWALVRVRAGLAFLQGVSWLWLVPLGQLREATMMVAARAASINATGRSASWSRGTGGAGSFNSRAGLGDYG